LQALKSWHGVCVTSHAPPGGTPLRPSTEDHAMKYEMLMLSSLLASSMLICGLTLAQML
jgi:hypothetical protein